MASCERASSTSGSRSSRAWNASNASSGKSHGLDAGLVTNRARAVATCSRVPCALRSQSWAQTNNPGHVCLSVRGKATAHALAGGEARHAATSADSPRAPSVGGWSPSAWAQARINPATYHPGGQLLCAARRSSNSRSRMLGKRTCGLAMGNTPSRCVMGYYSTAGRLGKCGGLMWERPQGRAGKPWFFWA